MPSEPVVILHSDSLLSKWGFGDGDEPEHWLDWCDDHGIEYNDLPSWRDHILPALIRKFLLPVLTQNVKVIQISTCHNPVRAETIDGKDVTDGWYETESRQHLTPEFVEVPMTEILQIARA